MLLGETLGECVKPALEIDPRFRTLTNTVNVCLQNKLVSAFRKYISLVVSSPQLTSKPEARHTQRSTMAGKNEKEDLLAEIESLKSIVKTFEGHVEPRHFAFYRGLDKMAEHAEETPKWPMKNVDFEIEQNFYKFSGMHCTKFEDSYVFEFSAGRKVKKGNIYAVEILNKDERGQLGNWVLPVSINLNEVLRETPIDDFVNLRPFLRRIKHLVQCHVAREEQYDQLKILVDDLANCETDTDPGYTRITIKISGLKDPMDIVVTNCYNVACYLFYKPYEARPRRVVCVPIDDQREFSDLLGKKFQKYVKPFAKFQLAEAFRRISGCGIFTWEPIEREQDVGMLQASSRENEEFNGEENFEGNDEQLDDEEKSNETLEENSPEIRKMEEENSKRKSRKRKTSEIENPVSAKKKRRKSKK